MSVRRTDRISGNKIKEYQGLSTDTKPTLEENNSGSTFLEVDTVKGFTWHEDQWYQTSGTVES
jgi:hypothetical protein